MSITNIIETYEHKYYHASDASNASDLFISTRYIKSNFDAIIISSGLVNDVLSLILKTLIDLEGYKERLWLIYSFRYCADFDIRPTVYEFDDCFGPFNRLIHAQKFIDNDYNSEDCVLLSSYIESTEFYTLKDYRKSKKYTEFMKTLFRLFKPKRRFRLKFTRHMKLSRTKSDSIITSNRSDNIRNKHYLYLRKTIQDKDLYDPAYYLVSPLCESRNKTYKLDGRSLYWP